MKTYVVKSSEAGMSLEKYIKKILNMAPLSFIYHLFRKKDIKVNGHWEKEKFIVSENDEVSIYVNDEQINEFIQIKCSAPKDELSPYIIYQDNNVLLINKPRGILVQKESANSKALDIMVISYLTYKKEYSSKEELAFVPGPAHRIDRNTSGLVIFGKNHNSLQYLFSLLKNHELIEKKYIALVYGIINEDGIINAPLKKENDNKVVVASIKNGGKSSITKYHVLKRFKDTTLLELTLLTGRTHQIRVHMQYINHPLIGDNKYGNFDINHEFLKKYNFKNQFLHAYKITFKGLDKPLENLSNKTFEAPMPLEYKNLLNLLEEEKYDDN